MSESTVTPPPRVLDCAARGGFGEFQQRVRRRPGIVGAALCLVILIVVENFLANGLKNGWDRGAVVLGLLIFALWGYIWFKRVRGGLYLFSEGFIDAAGRRVVDVRWSQIRSIEGQGTQYLIGPFPVGRTFAYCVGTVWQIPGSKSDFEGMWRLNTTYVNVIGLAELISRRSGVPVTGVTNPYQL